MNALNSLSINPCLGVYPEFIHWEGRGQNIIVRHPSKYITTRILLQYCLFLFLGIRVFSENHETIYKQYASINLNNYTVSITKYKGRESVNKLSSTYIMVSNKTK